MVRQHHQHPQVPTSGLTGVGGRSPPQQLPAPPAPIPPCLPDGLEGEDSGDDTVVACQFMAGVEFELADGVHLFGGYRYMGTADIEIERLTATFDTHAVEAGIRMQF